MSSKKVGIVDLQMGYGEEREQISRHRNPGLVRTLRRTFDTWSNSFIQSDFKLPLFVVRSLSLSSARSGNGCSTLFIFMD